MFNKDYKIKFVIISLLLVIINSMIVLSNTEYNDSIYLNIDSINSENNTIGFNLNALQTNLTTQNDIELNLEYDENSNFDEDNDGIETTEYAIDFTTENSYLGNLNESNQEKK